VVLFNPFVHQYQSDCIPLLKLLVVLVSKNEMTKRVTLNFQDLYFTYIEHN